MATTMLVNGATTRSLLTFVTAAWISLETLKDLLPSLVLAVPKKKTSHSRKSMRSANKGLKDKQNIVSCSACGSPKLAHHLCPNCYSDLNRQWKDTVGK